uniref:Uncharacterized protein n=1 Tax=Vespula pensylvanica TaxID=30213 RepID=A0A834P0F3_VESPE|nr:hypothetical protein H0235_008734 [Vespula pensylvanica]
MIGLPAKETQVLLRKVSRARRFLLRSYCRNTEWNHRRQGPPLDKIGSRKASRTSVGFSQPSLLSRDRLKDAKVFRDEILQSVLYSVWTSNFYTSRKDV